jgi:hypothetical protein
MVHTAQVRDVEHRVVQEGTVGGCKDEGLQ